MDVVEVAAATEGRQPAGPEGSASDLIAEARGVHRIYETGRVSVHALNGLDLAIERGDVSIVTPVLGIKVVLVAAFVTLVLREKVSSALWLAAALSASLSHVSNTSPPLAARNAFMAPRRRRPSSSSR